LFSPLLPAGQTRTDTFIGRVYYEYQTVARGTVWVYSESEADAVRSSKGTFEKSSFTSTKGPLKVDVSVSPETPILSSSDNLFTVEIRLSNIGGGTVYRINKLDYTSGEISLGTEDLDKVYVSFNSPDLIVSGCTGEQELIAGKDTTLACDVRAPVPVAKQGYSAEIVVSYGYYKEASTTVTVSGR